MTTFRIATLNRACRSGAGHPPRVASSWRDHHASTRLASGSMLVKTPDVRVKVHRPAFAIRLKRIQHVKAQISRHGNKQPTKHRLAQYVRISKNQYQNQIKQDVRIPRQGIRNIRFHLKLVIIDLGRPTLGKISCRYATTHPEVAILKKKRIYDIPLDYYAWETNQKSNQRDQHDPIRSSWSSSK